MKLSAINVLIGSIAAGAVIVSSPSLPQYFSHEPFPFQAASSMQEGNYLLTSQCKTCHTLEIVTSQRLDRRLWTRVVNKMIIWGSTFDTTKKDELIDFLSARYNPTSPDVDQPLIPSTNLTEEERTALRSLVGNAIRGKEIYGNACAVCHEEPREGVITGTVLEDNPILDNPEAFWDVVLNGRLEMPAYSGALSQQAIADVLAWLRRAD